MRGSRKLCQRRSNFDNDFFVCFFFLLVDEGEGGYKYHYKRAIFTILRFAGVPMVTKH